MTNELTAGERVRTPAGKAGTLVRVRGALASVVLDDSLRVATTTAALEKIHASEVDDEQHASLGR